MLADAGRASAHDAEIPLEQAAVGQRPSVGSALNSHLHFHVVVLDGVFSEADDGSVTFHPVHLSPRSITCTPHEGQTP